MTIARLRRVQWAVRAALTLGVAASVTANILHAQPDPIAQAIAAWPPLALLITVELVSRIPIHRKGLGAVRVIATTAIAGIAAWVSYWHMAAVASRYGEVGASPFLLPLSVDGLIVVASVSLVELAGRIRDLSAPPAAAVPAAVSLAPARPGPGAGADDACDPGVAPSEPADGPAPAVAHNSSGERPSNGDQPGTGPDPDECEPGSPARTPDLAPDLVPLLPAARAARDELAGEGRTVSRDALATRLRANGHPIRNTRVAELLAALKAEAPSGNGSKPMAHV